MTYHQGGTCIGVPDPSAANQNHPKNNERGMPEKGLKQEIELQGETIPDRRLYTVEEAWPCL